MPIGETAGQSSAMLAGVEDGKQQARGSSSLETHARSSGSAPYHSRGRDMGVDGSANGIERPPVYSKQQTSSPDARWTATAGGVSPPLEGGAFSSANPAAVAAAAHRIPTPTEQTPSPRRSSNVSNGGGGSGFAFELAASPNGHRHSSSSNGGEIGNGNDHGVEVDDCRRCAFNGIVGPVGGNRGRKGEGSLGCSPAQGEWRELEREGTRYGSDGEPPQGGGGGGGGGARRDGGAAAFREELDVFSASLRKDFELKLLVTARDGLKAACERERSAARLRLEAHKRQSGEEILHLEEDGRRLRADVAGLQAANEALAGKVEILGERLAALHARTSAGSCVARCLCAWRVEAARVRAERSRNSTAVAHARRKLMSRSLSSWRAEARLRIDSRGRKAADQKLHAISKEIIGRYEAELSSTRAALDDAINQIALEKARQRDMEEGMRRTLLRGMSAMNMEAMRLMTEARGAGEEVLGFSGSTVTGTQYSAGGTEGSFAPRAPPGTGHHRMSEEWPRPLTPPRPAAPSSR